MRDAARDAAGRRAPGLGDRWLAGERVPGVRFGWGEAVRVTAGPLAGSEGTVLLLAHAGPEAAYVVRVDGRGEVRLAQDALAPLAPGPREG